MDLTMCTSEPDLGRPPPGRRPAEFFHLLGIIITPQDFFLRACLPPARGGPPPPVVNIYVFGTDM